MNEFLEILRHYPELTVFLTLASGFALGNILLTALGPVIVAMMS